jgi:CRP-like cAMP-binding protein
MALLDPELPMRMASVKTLTNVNLAVMTREKFVEMSELYPQFKENIEKMVKIRLHQFLK